MRVSTTWVSRVLISVLAAWAGIAAGAPVQGQHIEVELVSEVKTIAAGQPFWLAVRLSPDPAWHTYWRNPGDSGLPTRIEWTLGAGGAVGNTLWPYPQRIPLSAQVVNYGYHDEVLLMTQVTPPASIEDSTYRVDAAVDWLVCKHVCIPGKARFQLSLPVTANVELDSNWHYKFERTRKQLPRDRPGWRADFTVANGAFELELKTRTSFFVDAEPLAYFPFAEDIVQNAAPQQFNAGGDTLVLRQTRSEYFTQPPQELVGLLVVNMNGRQEAYRFTAVPSADKVAP